MAAGAVITQLCGNGDLVHIHDCVTAAADEVDMGIGIGIETLRAVYGGNAGDLTLLLEKSQIPVDRCLRDVGMCFLQHLMHHLCRGVGVCVHQAGQDRIALSEVLGVLFHRHQPFLYLRVILIYKRIITYLF